MAKKLSPAIIKKRMQALHNLQRLYAVARDRITNLEQIIKLQDQQIKKQEEADRLRDGLIDAQAIRIAELEAMVFGKKKRPPTGTPAPKDEVVTNPKVARTKGSYRRPLPPVTAITATELVPVDRCQCGGQLTNLTTHDRYVEDIPLPDLTEDYQAHLVTRYVVERGVCTSCGKASSGQNLGGAVVALGPNVRLLVTHLTTVLGMSYASVANLLLSLYGVRVTDGDITNILAKQHQVWLPAYEQLKADIRASPVVHGDESPWPIQSLQGQGYAWNLSDANSPKVCFTLENSRGAPHAKHLFGVGTNQPFTGTRISDDYGVYRSLPGSQQLCWAHLYRCIRDLRYNDSLPEEQLPYVQWWYEQFAAAYQDLSMYLGESFDEVVRHTQADELWQRVQALCQLAIPATGEPEKLTRLKAQLTRAGKDKLFTCLPNDTPCDNNRAERDLRQLVLKRKRCFGSKTEKGAQALATVLSICTTTWRTNPNNYFSTLAALA